ncbi:hypothetical protein F5X68DRAFT_230004 [Plectosphaerella plurivora]|uniref:Uncharacterized protein n=1 Tax=Plectosphaerella plurivora TaxID=936078 RepID=A0A9P9AF13_9PEZI|nr:hypothetical protein F5X68DRAFT_230004 [Plectosphaerella plurivora]
MDQLRKLARTSFERSAGGYKSNDAGTLRLFQLPQAGNGTAPTPPEHTALTEPKLLQLLDEGDARTRDQTQDTSATASLRLVVVPRSNDDAVEMSHEAFGSLIDRFKMDSMVLQHIASNSYGFHAHADSHTYYVGTYVYSLAWSANPKTLRTNAVLLLRTAPILKNGDLIRDSFFHILCEFAPHLHAPHFLLFVIYVHLSTTSQVAVALNVESVRKVETLTKHGPGRGADSKDDTSSTPMVVDIDELSKAAQDIAVTQVHLANLQRHDPYIKDIAAYLRELSHPKARPQAPDDKSVEPARLPCLDKVPPQLRGKCKSSLESLSAMLHPLEKMTSDLEPTVRFLQTRANCQSSVISSLMTHEDARLNTELARLSTELGEASRRDSSAMRSIAMMTMIFLPATFFAALFSMSCIPEWAKTNFWAYWACALPSTFIVFIVFKFYHRGVDKAKQHQEEHKKVQKPTDRMPSLTSTEIEMTSMNGKDINVPERALLR